MKKIRTTPSLRKKSKSRKKINRISTSKKPTKKRTSRKKRSKRQKGGMHPDDIHSRILRRYIGQKRRSEGQGEIPPIVLDHDIRPPPFNPSAPTAPSARSFAVQTDAAESKIKKTKQSNFFDKPKGIQFNAKIPRPPKGVLKDKEYIVFQKDIGSRVGGTPYFIFISSFGRYLHWQDFRQMEGYDLPPLFFINQGWISLLNFLDSSDVMTNRLILPFMGEGADRMGGLRWRSCIEFIPRFLSLYVQFFPDSVITETNNDPDVFFNK